MNSFLLRYKSKIRELLLYGVIGGTAALIDAGIYYILTRAFYINEYASNFISINVGIMFSFILNTFINFKKKDKLLKRGISFFCIGYIGLLMSMGIIFLGINIFGLSDFFAKIISIILAALTQYILNSTITYNRIVDKGITSYSEGEINSETQKKRA